MAINVELAQREAVDKTKAALTDWVGQQMQRGLSPEAIATATDGVGALVEALVPPIVETILQHILDNAQTSRGGPVL